MAGRAKLLCLLGGLLILGVILLISFPPLREIPACAALLVHSARYAPIALPANCVARPDVATDDMVKYLEKERIVRRLVFKEWIICGKVGQFQGAGLAFMDDPHWLPSYVPGRYQYRRTVIIVPYAQPAPQGSPVVAEVCLMPWSKYVLQIAGQCGGKYSVWR